MYHPCRLVPRTYLIKHLVRPPYGLGIMVKATHPAMLSEEAPQVYKSSAEVVDVVHNLGIATEIAKLMPLGVSKG